MESESLATELLHTLKATMKKQAIIIILLIIALFATNLAWIYAWNLPSEEIITTVTQDSDGDGTNNYIGNDGDINGETNSPEKSN